MLRFTFGRGVTFALSTFAFGLLAFAFAGRFALPFAPLRFAFAFAFAGLAFAFAFVLPFLLPFAFSFWFLGFLGLFSFAFAFALVFRFSLASSTGVTVSGDSPSLAGRLTSIATV